MYIMYIMITNKKFLIFGGTGSLGYELNKRYICNNKITNFSRDENKHWKMRLDFKDNSNNKNMDFIIGNTQNYNSVENAILRINPDIIIMAAANKHIELCEINTEQSISTNLLGNKNILDAIEKNKHLINTTVVVFISSDKACSPINNYGMSKALSETLMIEKAYYMPNIKFVNVRYGNVLTSRGSIIPTLNELGKNKNIDEFTLTHSNMTRFMMRLEQSVDLIEYAILNGESGDTIIPQLVSMKMKDLIELFCEKYDKKLVIIGLRAGEKMYESLINETQSGRLVVKSNYSHIKSVLKYPNIINNDMKDYNSNMCLISKEDLKNYLIKFNIM